YDPGTPANPASPLIAPGSCKLASGFEPALDESGPKPDCAVRSGRIKERSISSGPIESLDPPSARPRRPIRPPRAATAANGPRAPRSIAPAPNALPNPDAMPASSGVRAAAPPSNPALFNRP